MAQRSLGTRPLSGRFPTFYHPSTQRIHPVHAPCISLNQETPITNNLNNPMAGVVAVDGVAQGPNSQPEAALLHGQGEVIPPLIPSHILLLEPGHVAPAASTLPALAPAPAPNVNLNPNPGANPTQPTLMGSFQGVGGIQFADEVPENPAAEVPAGQNIQGPVILLEHAMPNEVALPHAPFVQQFAPVQAMPAAAAAVVAPPFVPVANDNPMQQPLLRSLHGFEGIQFEDQGKDEDD